MTGGITMGNNKVTATYTPSANADLTTKTYVDGILGSATSAATSASAAATSATNAASSATASASSASAAAASYDSFDDRYLGAKSSAPSVDNDGDALTTGALYWNTSNNSLFIWTGSAWNAAAFDTSGALVAVNNLSDLNNAATARTNLGFNAGVDAHLNTSTAANGEFLSWNGSDYDWAAAGVDLYAANESSPTAQPSATGANAIAIGNQAVSSGADSVALGHSKAAGKDTFAAAIQNSDGTYGALEARSVAIGSQAKVASGATGGSVAIGNSALVTGSAAVAFGFLATASGAESAAFGRQATAAGNRSVTVGRGYSLGTDSFAAGIGSTSTSLGAQHNNTVALGYQAVTTGSNQIALGGGSTVVRISGAYTLPTADGSANQVLTTDGSGAVTFVDAAGAADDIFYENNTTVASNYTITSGKNAMTAGPVTIASGVTVTVPSGSRWAVV